MSTNETRLNKQRMQPFFKKELKELTSYRDLEKNLLTGKKVQKSEKIKQPLQHIFLLIVI